jgi:hypothetical protein
MEVETEPARSLSLQLMATGQVPRDVFDPTFHFHTMEPVVPVFLSPKPEAVDDPEAY